MRRILLAGLALVTALVVAGCCTSSNRYEPCWWTYVVDARCGWTCPDPGAPDVVRPVGP